MNFAPDLTIYADDRQYKVAGFTPCGAPKYDLRNPTRMPARGMGSADGRRVLALGEYGVSESWFHCFDIASGKELWSYPDNFVGVHGSHQACPPAVGMIRGSFGPCGVAQLAAPIGGVWVIPTNVGEWHIVSDEGFYLTRLFQGDPMKVVWPDKALPGAVLDNCPPGLGGEDFGGSCCLAKDGKFFVQAGKTGFWNIEVVGLETVKPLGGNRLAITPSDVVEAEKIRVEQLQASVGTKRMTVKKKTVTLSGNFDQDFSGADVIQFQKQEEARVRAAAAWDDQNLYLAWDVRDKTPWINKAAAPEQMYVGGDTRRLPARRRSAGGQESRRGCPRRSASFDWQLQRPTDRRDLSPRVGREETETVQLRRRQDLCDGLCGRRGRGQAQGQRPSQ